MKTVHRRQRDLLANLVVNKKGREEGERAIKLN